MNNRKFHPIRTISKLVRSASRSSQSRTFERNLKARVQADAYYTAVPMSRI